MVDLIPLLNVGLPLDIAKYINNYRRSMFKQRINEFEFAYRSILYLKQYVIPDCDASYLCYKFIKYGRYIIKIINYDD